jgi:colicin import membrane protein
MTESSYPYTVPKEPGRWLAILLAALVHAGLLALLWIGVQWQSETPTTLQAEIWTPPIKDTTPTPVKAPKPEPKPEPVVKAPPKPEVPEPPVPDPDIVLEQEKKRKLLEEKKRLEEERLAQEKKRQEEERLAQEQKRLEEERLAQERKRKEEERQARLKQEEAKRLAREKAEQERKAAEEMRRKQEEAELAKARQEEMARITGGVGTSTATSQGGRASAEYGAKVAALIKSHTVFNVPNGLTGNPAVEYAVDLLPDGSLHGVPRKLKSSGVPGFDEAVLRAIDKSQPFPRDERSGSVPSSFTVSHKPKDQ